MEKKKKKKMPVSSSRGWLLPWSRGASALERGSDHSTIKWLWGPEVVCHEAIIAWMWMISLHKGTQSPKVLHLSKAQNRFNLYLFFVVFSVHQTILILCYGFIYNSDLFEESDLSYEYSSWMSTPFFFRREATRLWAEYCERGWGIEWLTFEIS